MQLTLPRVGCVEDFHLLVSAPCRAHKKKGKTPVLSAEETRALLDSIDVSTMIALRDRALIALMTYTFLRVSAAAQKMRVKDVYVYVQKRRLWVRLPEKGGDRRR